MFYDIRLKKIVYIASLLSIAFSFVCHSQEISLAGKWSFAIDSLDVGINEKWFNKKLSGNIQLPGSMNTNNLGNDIALNTKWTASIYDSSFFFQPRFAKYRQQNNIKIPFWLTPSKYYVGAAWYQKMIDIPANWKSKKVSFFIERTHIASSIWIDGIKLDTQQNSLVAPHTYFLPKYISQGKHLLTVRIDNRLLNAEVGQDSHSVSDHTQGNWNGMIGKISLIATDVIYNSNLEIYPDIENKKITVKGILINDGDKPMLQRIKLAIYQNEKKIFSDFTQYIVVVNGSNTTWEKTISLSNNMKTWNEFHPNLYQLGVTINKDEKLTSFGMREVSVSGKNILINNKKVFLRGNLNNCEFPLTGFPPMKEKQWITIYKKLKEFGINHIRFHSWCPPEVAFSAADKIGMYLQPEAPTWPNHGTSVGDGRFIDTYIYSETDRIIKHYGNHPSFIMLAAGNEPAGKNQSEYLAQFIKHYKSKDNRRIYTGASVATSWPLVPENEYMVKSGARGLNFNSTSPNSMDDFNATIEKYPVPFIQHEQGQWCVFPDFTEIKKYTGAFKAKNFELFKEDFESQGMTKMANSFLMASGKLQALCYKMEIERSLRTNDIAGFQLLGLQDFPGQGTALVGVLNSFYQEKGYITPKEFNQFCNATVPLIKTKTFTLLNSDTLNAEILIAHYGENDLTNLVIEWQLTSQQNSINKKGAINVSSITRGTTTSINKIQILLNEFKQAQQVILSLKIKGTTYKNNWNFWVYPQYLSEPKAEDVYIIDTIDSRVETILQNGGKVLLQLNGKIKKGSEVVQSFTPVFWNTSWFKMRPPHTLGLFIDTASKVLQHFPTSYHSDFQWWEIIHNAQVMHLEDFPKSFTPIISNIDTWFMNRKLAMLFEVKIGKGKLMVFSANLKAENENNPTIKQFKYSLLKYLNSNAFNPKTEVSLSTIKKLINEQSKFVFDAFTKDNPDELKPIK